MGETGYGKCRNLSVNWEFSKINNIWNSFIPFVESNRLLRRSQHSSLLLQQDKKLQKIELGQVSCERFEIFAYDFFPVRDVTPTLLVLYISCREQRSHYLQVDYSKI
jgi:hypothetical protein